MPQRVVASSQTVRVSETHLSFFSVGEVPRFLRVVQPVVLIEPCHEDYISIMTASTFKLLPFASTVLRYVSLWWRSLSSLEVFLLMQGMMELVRCNRQHSIGKQNGKKIIKKLIDTLVYLPPEKDSLGYCSSSSP